MDSALSTQIELKYIANRKQTLQLCYPLGEEDSNLQAAEFVSPVKWHIAHTTWFFEEFILSKIPGYTRFNDDFAFLFNSYYNGIGKRISRNERGLISRPYLKEVLEFRKYVDEHILTLLSGDFNKEQLNLVELGLQHEQQHQELLITDLKYCFSLNPIYPIYKEGFSLVNSLEKPANKVLLNDIYTIGYAGKKFSFDNEHGKHRVLIENVEIEGNLVTNKEYLEFINSGGYEDFSLWLDEGWTWVCENTKKAPLYWELLDGQWFQYTLGGLVPINLEACVCHVNYYEANAYATWKGMRLPTEFEWEAAAPKIKWGAAWEWTNSAYLPYPGFKTAKGAVGEYNGKFMVNQMVLRGASPATAAGHSRASYRNFFHPQYQWQVSGIRLAKDLI